MEIYAATRAQDGRPGNEDAFLLGRGEVPYAALCDGSGNAQQAARRVLGLLEAWLKDATTDDLARFQVWEHWCHLLDSALLGSAQSTFLAVAFLGRRIVGTCAGDSRLYRVTPDGQVAILTEEASKFRLGSGKVAPFPIHHRVRSGDVLLLMSDGAWTPLGLTSIQRVVAKARSRHLSEMPSTLLEEAGKHGRADDMTVVVARIPDSPGEAR